MPASRVLAGLDGDLYDRHSEAHNASLESLLKVLIRIGFKGMKKKANETTLRVYPVKFGAYPLLNPGFEATVALPRKKVAKEALVFWVLSRGDSLLHEFLGTLPAEGECPFHIERRLELDVDYVLHGRFVLPLSFRVLDDGNRIDFGAMQPALKHLHGLLQYRKTP